jgi:hypothetical protein
MAVHLEGAKEGGVIGPSLGRRVWCLRNPCRRFEVTSSRGCHHGQSDSRVAPARCIYKKRRIESGAIVWLMLKMSQ